VRSFSRYHATWVVALTAGAIVVLRAPVRALMVHLPAAARPDLVLAAGLCLLVSAFALHQYRQRRRAQILVGAASAEAEQGRALISELELLIAFGRALGHALEPTATRQIFWRFMPTFAGNRGLWMVTRRRDHWDSLVHEATASNVLAREDIEVIATSALSAFGDGTDQAAGVIVDNEICFPMVIGSATVGVVGVRNAPNVSASERHALSAATSLLAIAIRNSQLLAQTQESSIRDSLTGCFNRAYAVEALSAELRRARRTSRPAAVLMFDVDQLKSVNQRYGHLTGDAILSTIGTHLSSMLRGTDIKCRIGGDEFLIILPDTVLEGADHVARSLVTAISNLRVNAGTTTVSPNISVGVVVAAKGETNPQSVMSEVDEALARVKRSGRGKCAGSALATAV
jgi:diguanylate cyclase (GGDEF)-like protein